MYHHRGRGARGDSAGFAPSVLQDGDLGWRPAAWRGRLSLRSRRPAPRREGDNGNRPVPGVTVTTHRADYGTVPPDRGVESIDEQIRRKGIRPIASADDLAQHGVFDTDEELDAFLAHVAAMRHADLA